MKTLSIGNSFSQDACGYLHQIAQSAGIELICTNLYIGGCSLERHSNNIDGNKADYALEINGCDTGRKVSIAEALALDTYDIVTIQQASHFSGKSETYYPFIDNVVNTVRSTQPQAKIYVHETWAYEKDSTHGSFPDYGSDQRVMYEALKEAYYSAAEHIGAEVIPVGDVIQYMRENVGYFDYPNGGVSLNRDGFHLSIPYGRMLAGYVWLETLTGADAEKSEYVPENAEAEVLNMIKCEVHNYLKSHCSK